ncbi:hypothetical protein ENUP19_0020G0034 [Entamoeba nuttalli]
MEEKANELDNQKMISICLIGSERVGKTTLLKIWSNEEFESVYLKTDEITSKTLKVNHNNTTLEVTIWDCSGDEFKNTRGTVDSYVSNGPIHVFVISQSDKGSVVFLKGFINSIFYRKSNPKRKYIIVTHCDEEDCTEGLIDEITQTLHSKRYNVCYEEIEKIKSILNEIVIEYANEFLPKPELDSVQPPSKKSCCFLF